MPIATTVLPSSHISSSSPITENNIKQNHTIHATLPSPQEGTLRYFQQNIGGLKYHGTKVDLTDILTQLRTYEFSILGLSEINIDTTKSSIRQSLHDQINHMQGNKISFSTSTLSSKNVYKPGGVLQVSSGNINRRFTKSITDPLGRWTGQGFIGKKGRHVYFLTLYVPCLKSKHSKGTTTTYAQQEQLLRIREGKYVPPRKQFYKDLTVILEQLEKPSTSQYKSKFVLSGDFNTAIEDDESLLSLCSRFNLIDIFYNSYGTREFSTYSRGKSRIDFTLLSRDLQDSFQGGGYTTFGGIFPSDHRGQYLIFDIKTLMGHLPDCLPRSQFRKLRSNNRSVACTYLKKLHKVLQNQNFYQRASTLFLSNECQHEEAERLDELYSYHAKNIESHLPNRFQYEYSDELLRKKAIVKIRKLQRSQLLTHIDYTEQISNLQLLHNIDDLSVPDSVPAARHFFKIAINEVKQAQKDHIELRKTFLDDLIDDLESEKTTVSKKRLQSIKTIKTVENII